tara:strand:- start:2444 stop:4669 length:2226 start_codon:yes stop_codon:yes gene_type:complete
MKLSELDLEKLRNLKTESKWSSIKSIKEINNEIKDLNLYDEKITSTCMNYLKKDVVKNKSFVLDKMLQKCKQIKKPKEKKAKKPRKGKSTAKQDKRLLQQNPVTPIPPKEKSYIEKNGNKIFNALVKADGDPVKALAILSKDKDFFNDTKKGFESALLGVISYFITDTQLAQQTFTITTTILSVLAGLYRLSQLGYIKKLKKKGLDFLGFGGGGGDDDDDDDDDDDTRRDFTINLNPELREIINNIKNYDLSDDKQDDKQETKKETKQDTKQSGLFPPTNSTLTSSSTNNEVFSFLQQQAQAQQQQQLKQARRNNDLLLQEQPTARKQRTEHELKEGDPVPTNQTTSDRNKFTSDGYTYFKYDNIDKFKERYKREFDSLRKEEKFKNFSDDDFYSSYQKAFDKQTSRDSLTDLYNNKNIKIKKTDNIVSKPVVSESLNIPETAKKEEIIIEPELGAMGNALPTRPEYVSPPGYWDKLKETLPLMAVATGLGAVYGVNVITSNILRNPTTSQLIPSSSVGDMRVQDTSLIPSSIAIGMQQEERSLLFEQTSPGKARERELGLGRPLTKFKNKYPPGSLSGRTPQPISRATSTSSNVMDLDLQLRGSSRRNAELDSILDQTLKEHEEQKKRVSLALNDEPVFSRGMAIDVPHSHEEEVRIDRLARERREGGLLIQRNEPISNRPSTTLTSGLAPEWRTRLANELTEIESDFYAMMDNMNQMSREDMNQMSSEEPYIPISSDDI